MFATSSKSAPISVINDTPDSLEPTEADFDNNSIDKLLNKTSSLDNKSLLGEFTDLVSLNSTDSNNSNHVASESKINEFDSKDSNCSLLGSSDSYQKESEKESDLNKLSADIEGSSSGSSLNSDTYIGQEDYRTPDNKDKNSYASPIDRAKDDDTSLSIEDSSLKEVSPHPEGDDVLGHRILTSSDEHTLHTDVSHYAVSTTSLVAAMNNTDYDENSIDADNDVISNNNATHRIDDTTCPKGASSLIASPTNLEPEAKNNVIEDLQTCVNSYIEDQNKLDTSNHPEKNKSSNSIADLCSPHIIDMEKDVEVTKEEALCTVEQANSIDLSVNSTNFVPIKTKNAFQKQSVAYKHIVPKRFLVNIRGMTKAKFREMVKSLSRISRSHKKSFKI